MKTDRRKASDVIDNALADALAAGLQPAELGVSQRSSLRDRILERIRDPAPEGTSTLRAGEGEWVALNELAQIRMLRQDESGVRTMLVRMLPGGVIDAHAHTREEECFVIEGEVEIGDHRLRSGDMHVARSGTTHQRLLSRTGALLLVRGEIPPDDVRLA